MNANLFRYGVLSVLTLTLAGCYVAAPYGYPAYRAPVYAPYPVARYPAYPVQPSVAYPRPAQPAPANQVAGSVYFDVNSAVVKPEYQNIVQAQASYLIGHPYTHVTLQGNADDRGGSGYNLSLGAKRADAVKQALMGYGVSTNQISTVSLGDKSPANPASNETAYAKNRRVDFRYQ